MARRTLVTWRQGASPASGHRVGVGLKGADKAGDHQIEDGGGDHGQGDLPEHPAPGGAVHPGGVVVHLTYRGQGAGENEDLKGVEQQTYRSCMGLLKLAEKYSDVLLEAACKKALSYTASPSFKSIKNILVTSSEKLIPETTDTKTTQKAHGITRGADYYRR